ncbi:MAG: YdeI/OmpD-associated family protein [Bacteroidales bacterium]
MNPEVDQYLALGCGRCSNYATPQCKVHNWPEELDQLRRIVLECGLHEEVKWSQPCYTFQGKNILLVTAFKEYAALAFFKGSLLKDPQKILVAPGQHSQASRQFRFTGKRDVLEKESVIKAYIQEAIELEKAGRNVYFSREAGPVPNELQDKFDELPALKSAFEGLTQGRQRGYILYFSQPKQAATRISRIERSINRIFKGKGINDR